MSTRPAAWRGSPRPAAPIAGFRLGGGLGGDQLPPASAPHCSAAVLQPVQLPPGLVQAPAEPLQVLLDEFRHSARTATAPATHSTRSSRPSPAAPMGRTNRTGPRHGDIVRQDAPIRNPACRQASSASGVSSGPEAQKPSRGFRPLKPRNQCYRDPSRNFSRGRARHCFSTISGAVLNVNSFLLSPRWQRHTPRSAGSTPSGPSSRGALRRSQLAQPYGPNSLTEIRPPRTSLPA